MLKKAKNEDAYTELKGVLGNAQDYHIYHMKKYDYALAYLIGFSLGAVVIYAFFRISILAVIFGVITAYLSPKYFSEYKKKQRQIQLRGQFRDLMESIAASYSSGKNTVDAFMDARQDMTSIYGEEADIVNELQIVCAGLGNNINIEVLLQDFATRCELEDIKSFADVFEICNRRGGDLKRIVGETRDIINDKMEIEMEIETMLSGNKNEFYIMMIMPLVIILSLSSSGLMSAASNSFANVVIKLVCLGIFGVAYVMGKKIIDIKV